MLYLALGTRWVARRAALSLAIMVGSFAPALAWAQSADVFVTKTGNATVNAGTNLTYDITVFNAGPDDADNVSISDALPAGTLFVTASQTGGPAFSCTTPPVGSGGTVTCDVALLPTLAPATFSLTVLVPADAASGLVGTNTATVTSTTPDPDTANNSSSVTTTVATSADLFVTKTGAPTVTAGTNLVYTITVGNPGPSDAQAVVVSDPLPAGTLFVTASQTAGPVFTCTTPPVGSGGTVTCDLATLPAFASATFSLTILVPADAPSGLVGTNTATVASTTADPDPATNTSSVSTTVATSADLFVLKAGDPTVTAGSNLTYTITVGNPGPSDAQAVVVSDPLPAGTLFVTASQTAGPVFTCTTPPFGSGGTVTCDLPTLPAFASATFSLTVLVPADAASGLVGTNTATVASTTADPDPATNTSSVSTTVATSADLFVLKAGAPTVTAGSNLTYTITVGNPGPSDAQAVVVSDPLPAGTLFVAVSQTAGPAFSCTTPPVGSGGAMTCNLATLPAFASAVFSLTVLVPADAASGLVGTNTATVASTTADPDPATNTSSVSTTVATSADVFVTKTGSATVIAGSNLTYTITVGNAGPSDAQTVVVSDPLPAGTVFATASQTAGPAFSCTTPVGSGGTVTCDLATLPAFASATFSLTVTISPLALDGTLLSNTATVTTATTDSASGNNSATAATTVTGLADLSISVAGPATVTPGTDVAYTVTVANAGPNAANGVSFSDTLPAGTVFVTASQDAGPAFACTTPAVGAGGTATCTIATLASGGTATFTLVVHLSPTATGTLASTATVAATTPDAAAGNNSATSTATVTASADLSVAKSGAAAAAAGSNLTYAITVANAGPSDAQSVSLSDPLPAGTLFVSGSQSAGPAFTCVTPPAGTSGTVTCTLPTLAAGASATFSLVVSVPGSTPNGTAVANTATVSSLTTDPGAANNSATTTATVSSPSDVSVTKTAAATVNAGANLTYTITVANAGPNVATGVTLADTLPAGTTFVSSAQTAGPAFTCTTPAIGAGGAVSCSAATLASAASATFSLVVQVSPTATGSIANTATVTTTSPDPAPGNNSATATATVGSSADVSVTKTAAATVNAGANLTYTINVANAGPSAAQTVSLSDPLPAGTTFVSATQTAGPALACTTPSVGAGGSVSCSIATLAAGTTATYSVVVNVAPSTLNGTVIANTATVTSATTDPVPGNGTATATTTVSGGNRVYTAASPTGSGTITATFLGGGATCAFAVSQFIPVAGHPSSPPAGSAPAGVVFPHGLFDFTTTGCTPGSTITVTITYPTPVAGDYWKYGPTPGNPSATWYRMPATFAGAVVTFSITDGGLGDDDLTANGTIVDQGGPGVSTAAGIPTLSEWMMILLAALLLLTGTRRVAFSRER